MEYHKYSILNANKYAQMAQSKNQVWQHTAGNVHIVYNLYFIVANKICEMKEKINI